MGDYPRLLIDLNRIQHNAKTITSLASRYGMSVTGVTKATCGDPKIAEAMLKGGVTSIGESRIENIVKLKEAGVHAEMMFLRTPMLSEVKKVVNYADISLNSELTVISRLSKEAIKKGVKHRIILMVDMGELREGVVKKELHPTINKVLTHKGIELFGVGMNLTCLTGVIPTKAKIKEFDSVVREIEDQVGTELKMVGGGNSANIPLLLEGHPKSKINNLRIGEGILLGLEAVHRTPIPHTYQNAFTLEAEIIELKEKPSVPDGENTQNAYGENKTFKNIGTIKRAILGIGRQDVIVDGLKPVCGFKILESSSDHIVGYNTPPNTKIGDILQFKPDYGALVNLFTSNYVHKEYIE
ncbi:MAG: alanine/ornithine racemase family PLP-dependent enzyme [Candidatus Altiarchaeota archaeon]|nr:alanine/ornithine racemase family PLP-dependent enzyme [Candidatus Altiarchaeota archaeon]